MKNGIKIVIIVAAVLALLAAVGFWYLYTHGMSGMGSTTKPKEGQIKVACVGDSITYGHGTTGWPKNTYPAQLQELLGEGYHVNNYGVSGYCVQTDTDKPYRSLKQHQQSLEYEADIVVFMMGTNDAKPYNWKGEEAFEAELKAFLDSFGAREIILCTPATAFFLNGQTEGPAGFDIQPAVVEQIAGIVRKVAEERGYALVDNHVMTAPHPEWFAADGIHPSDEGAKAIAQNVYMAILGDIGTGR